MRNSILVFLVLCFLFPCTLQTEAQHYYFKHFQVEDGLSNNTAICTLQDSKGFMWFGTKDGLNRFDGYSFKIYRNNPRDSTSIGNNSIWRLHEDEKGILWVGTERGLYRYNRALETFNLVEDIPRSEISGITSDRAGNLWVIAGFKVYRLSPAVNKLKKYDNDSTLNFCVTISRSLTGDIWIGNIHGQILRYDPVSEQFPAYSLFSHSKPAPSGWIEKIYDSGLGFLFIGTSNQGVKTFDPITLEYKDILTYNEDKTEIYVRDFLRNTEKEFWIATESGIYIYNVDDNSFQHLKKSTVNPYALSDNAIYSFAKDREGGIWASSYFGGVNYYSNQKLTFDKYFFTPGSNSLRGNAVREIKQDKAGNLWIGTEDAGLNSYNPTTGNFIALNPDDGYSGIAHTNIHGLAVDEDKLWVGTFEHGLDILDIQTKKVVQHFEYGPGPYDLKSNFVHSVFKTSSGQIIAGTSNGMFLYNKEHRNFLPLKFFPDNVFFSAITEDAKGNLWIGTFKNGLYYFNPQLNLFGRLRFLYNGTDRFEKSRVTYTYIDSRQLLWVCTEDGLFRINIQTKKIKPYSTGSGLPGNLIYGIVEDDNQYLWITTSKGLVRMNAATGATSIFTQANGLLGNQFNYSSVFKDSSGRIYLGSVKGMIAFNPGELNTRNIVPPVYITNMQINNVDIGVSEDGPLKKSMLHTHRIRLNHLQSSISFDFAALYFTSPQSIEYAYKLEGSDEDWNYIKTNRRVYFTNLSPGTYRFVVKSTDSNGNWPANEKALLIEILPPWWLGNLAYFLYSLAGIFTIYFIIRFYHNRQKEKQKIQMALFERAKEKEIYESKIDFFTKIAHEIRTPLTLIKAPMEKIMRNIGEVPQVEKYLKVMDKNTRRLLDLTNQLLDFRKVESGEFALHKANTNISELFRTIHSGFLPLAERKNIKFEMEVYPKDIFGYIDEEATTKIISNLYDNAVKYSRSFVRAEIRRPSVPESVDIIISNDGLEIPDYLQDKIFEPFFRSPNAEKITGTGIGLPLAKSLTELQGGTLMLESGNGFNIFTLHLPLNLKP